LAESLITISVIGLMAGVLFSMPISGPISILITSNALKGRLRYCNLATLGASFADFVYVFGAVYGLTNFYSLYKPVIPYVLLAGTLFFLYLGYKISKTNVDLEHIEDKSHIPEKIKEKGGFWTGFILNFLNPTLFLGWLTSSFIVITLVASLGFNTGGLDKSVGDSYEAMNKTNGDTTLKNKVIPYLHLDSMKFMTRQPTSTELARLPKNFPLLLSLSYAFCVTLGSVVWFFYLAFLLAKHRHRININSMNRIIHVLGMGLCLLGLFLGYKAVYMLI
jgi:threonine/homoserine/homoserine lactone efflux protein